MKLFTPFRLGDVRLKNRIVMAPMITGFAEKDSSVSQKMIDYYVRRAKGDCGLIVVEGTSIEPIYHLPGGLRIDQDQYITGMSKLASAIKAAGAHVILQLAHCGKQSPSLFFDQQPVAPSAVPDPAFNEMPRALEISEIEQLVGLFVRGAVRVKEAGFDGIEIHGAHGYLISEFLSPYDNIRTDKYGGDTQGRTLFPRQIIKGIREALGEFIISFRISAEQYTDGLHLQEAKAIVPLLEDAGADVIHVTAGRYSTREWMIQPMTLPQGCLVPLAAQIHRVARKPVICVGRIGTPDLAEQILQEGHADLVALGRPLFADPDWPIKAREGKAHMIRPCVGCNTCLDNVYKPRPLKCSFNPELGHGQALELQVVSEPKKVLVVGGGPGGMEAARSLAMLGHQVALWEKSDRLGGQLILAMAAPGREEFKYEIDYYRRELERLGVNVKLEHEATVESILREAPDAVILATGVIPTNPAIPGVEDPHVAKAHDVLAGIAQAGEQVVVIGGAYTGCETARFLAAQGKKVTLLRRGSRIAAEAGWSGRPHIMESLKALGVESVTRVQYKRIDKDGVHITISGDNHFFPAETVVMATGVKPNRNL
ncbi:FAD-dependent oxidoreductase, partial [Thermodesulfobacteriota bacterium]